MLIGTRLNDRYKILDIIGTGGMATVYRAIDGILNREVAVKVLRHDHINEPDFIKRFNREAQSALSLSHQNIVSIYDVGTDNEVHYIVMEYVKGCTLKQYIQQNAPLSLPKALHIMEQLTSAISHAHHNNIIHRDIKPQNILLNENGTVKVTDFGIATAVSSVTITQTNTLIGSVHYISPEQAKGGSITKQTDIYSIGIVFFELLTGYTPFTGDSAVSIALKHLQNETPSIRKINPNIPQSVENIILKSTVKDVLFRFKSVDEMHQEIVTALNPDKLHIEAFKVPDIEDDATKVIPIIKDENRNSNASKDQTNDTTKKLQKKKNKKVIWGTIITILTLIAIVLAIVIPRVTSPDDVEIPDVANMDYDNAVKNILSSGLEIGDVIELSSDEIKEGKVIKTSPAIGTIVKESSKITIYKSIGKQKVEMEEYIGKQYEDIVEELNGIFKEVKIYKVTSDVPEGEIIEQTPLVGEKIIPKETNVSLVVSDGPEKVKLLDFVGSSVSLAEKFREENKIRLDIKEEYSDKYDKGLIISQSPKAEVKIKQGDLLSIVVSKGPKEKPPATVNVEVFIPFDPNSNVPQQQVQIYIDDLNHVITQPAETFYITSDTTKTIQITVPYGKEAEYKIQRDQTVIINEKVPYPTDN
jgi:serine/threonine-protein kinase